MSVLLREKHEMILCDRDRKQYHTGSVSLHLTEALRIRLYSNPSNYAKRTKKKKQN